MYFFRMKEPNIDLIELQRQNQRKWEKLEEELCKKVGTKVTLILD